MKQPKAFLDLLSALHQDALVGVASLEDFAANALAFVRDADLPDLRAYLGAVCADMTDAEIKGVLQRGNCDLVFDTKSAGAFLRAVLAQLSSRPQRSGEPGPR